MRSSKKAIPNGKGDFAVMAANFVRQIVPDPQRFEIAPRDAEELDAVVKRYQAALRPTLVPGGCSASATRAMRDARRDAEDVVRRLRNVVRLNKRIDAATKVLLGICVSGRGGKKVSLPLEPPRLRFVRALHEAGASPMHVLSFTAFDRSKGRPEGADRLELFVDLIPPEERIPLHPGANQGGRPWYLWSYRTSPIIIAPPMPRVPMRVVYWGRWAGSGSGPGNVGPFSATCAGWIEGGSHHHLPGAALVWTGNGRHKNTPLLDPPVLPQREERYSVAVLEVHLQSLMPTRLPALESRADGDDDAPRQIEGPAEEEAA
jgi:hypothetical protein